MTLSWGSLVTATWQLQGIIIATWAVWSLTNGLMIGIAVLLSVVCHQIPIPRHLDRLSQFVLCTQSSRFSTVWPPVTRGTLVEYAMMLQVTNAVTSSGMGWVHNMTPSGQGISGTVRVGLGWHRATDMLRKVTCLETSLKILLSSRTHCIDARFLSFAGPKLRLCLQWAFDTIFLNGVLIIVSGDSWKGFRFEDLIWWSQLFSFESVTVIHTGCPLGRTKWLINRRKRRTCWRTL